ncbi:helix-turn-helix domain-containing protein [Streptomyces mutabilis]|uniref:helix-turn-helix domain-containing protein n=1 Tax=Streptomyces mutabilis TaxID=67332 RepID=UPI003A4C618C
MCELKPSSNSATVRSPPQDHAKRSGALEALSTFRSVAGADVGRSLRYAVAVRYAQGGGLAPQGQAARERVRMLAVDGFVRGEKATVIAKELRVSVRSVERWRGGGLEVLPYHCGPAEPCVVPVSFPPGLFER